MGEGMIQSAQDSFSRGEYQVYTSGNHEVKGGLGAEALETAKKVGLIALKVLAVVAHIAYYVLGLLIGRSPNDIDTDMSYFHRRIDKQLGIE
jgi:hypothetical protein